jgi:uncharacterized protein
LAILEKHAPGSFCWLELATSNQEEAKKFYTGLFGWEAVDNPMGPGEIYTIFKLQGKETGATYTLRPDMKGVPPHWMPYVSVKNADKTAEKITSAGGKIEAGPFDVMTFGRMAVGQDPTGAMFCIWEPKDHIGTRIAGVPGTLCWADLNTPDAAAAKKFYSSVFGWDIQTGEHDTSGYLHIKNGDQFIGGIPSDEQRNKQAPPHWMLYFEVADVDASTAKVKQTGGRVYMEPMSMENVGRMSAVADPQGAAFMLFKSAMQGSGATGD